MKKTFTLILIFVLGFNCIATPPKFRKEKQKYNGLNGAGAWFMVAGGSLLAGGCAKMIGSSQTVPEIGAYQSDKDYTKALNKYQHGQDLCNGVFGAGVAVAGLSFVFAGADMFFASRNLKLNDQANIGIRTTRQGLSLCLNFK